MQGQPHTLQVGVGAYQNLTLQAVLASAGSTVQCNTMAAVCSCVPFTPLHFGHTMFVCDLSVCCNPLCLYPPPPSPQEPPRLYFAIFDKASLQQS